MIKYSLTSHLTKTNKMDLPCTNDIYKELEAFELSQIITYIEMLHRKINKNFKIIEKKIKTLQIGSKRFNLIFGVTIILFVMDLGTLRIL